MRVTFPHMGNLWISLKAMLTYLGVPVVVPPPCNKQALQAGAKWAPEFACLPLKLNLGNFIQAREMGADTIVMAGGCGPCRFGYYAQVEHVILRDLGYDYHLVVMEPPEKHIGELLQRIKYITGQKSWWQVMQGIRFGFRKACLVDRLEKKAFYLRPREKRRGATEQALQAALSILDAASNWEELEEARQRAWQLLEEVPTVHRPVLRVALIGEIYTLLEPFANLELEKRLGEMGVEVDRSIYLSEWINDHLFLGLVRGMRSSKAFHQAALPYLAHFVGGHGQESVGSAVYYAGQGYDGAIHVLPFTCMPEIVAMGILPRVSQDTGMPVMSLIVDEHSGAAGVQTRLEAFVDLLARQKRSKGALA
ncbi:MAG: CoA protein activase [Desulfurispora sp.]|uniref:CoA protein activase n=1 Tax=Desulfurispora sp. TaxID=3014275 RepID=UPI004049A1BE